MRYNDRRFSIEGGAGLMGKYQLKSRRKVPSSRFLKWIRNAEPGMSKLMIKMLLSKR